MDVADLWDKLMRGLGFAGYVAQGGDIGSFISRLLGERYDGCKGEYREEESGAGERLRVREEQGGNGGRRVGVGERAGGVSGEGGKGENG